MKLTLEQRAKRRTTRINNKLKVKYPLFAEQFATNIDAEKDNLTEIDKRTGRHLHRLFNGFRVDRLQFIKMINFCKNFLAPSDLKHCFYLYKDVHYTQACYGLNQLNHLISDKFGINNTQAYNYSQAILNKIEL